jgi:hypothetical protein
MNFILKFFFKFILNLVKQKKIFFYLIYLSKKLKNYFKKNKNAY